MPIVLVKMYFFTKWNLIFYYTCCITPKCVACLPGPFPHHRSRAAQLLAKKYRSGGEPLAKLCRFDRPRFEPQTSAAEMYAILLDQPVGRRMPYKLQ